MDRGPHSGVSNGREDETGKSHNLTRKILVLPLLSVVVTFARQRRGTNESLRCKQSIEPRRDRFEGEVGRRLASRRKVTLDNMSKLVFG